jgi:hypothetical protein
MTAEESAAERVLDAAFIAGTMDSDSVFDHYEASDYLRWCAARYAEAVTGEPSYHEWDFEVTE